MYLGKEIYIGETYDHRNIKRSENFGITESDKAVDLTGEISEITMSIGYWRKANQIHRWFVEHVQDGVDECQKSYVSTDQLINLKTACEDALTDPELASSILPPQEGFFFGSDELDEWYFNDLKDTIKIIDKALKIQNGTFYYQSSW